MPTIDAGVTRIPEHKCPYCGYRFDAVGTGDGTIGTPSPDDLMVCIECAGILAFNPDMTGRAVSPEELLETFAKDKEWEAQTMEMVRRIRSMPWFGRPKG